MTIRDKNIGGLRSSTYQAYEFAEYFVLNHNFTILWIKVETIGLVHGMGMAGLLCMMSNEDQV